MALTRFLIRRILSGIVVLWVVSTAAFFLFFARNPEIVARQLAGRAATTAIIAEVTRNLGLNQPILTQYWHFLDRIVHGNLGLSYYNGGITVASIVGRDLPRTGSLLLGGALLLVVFLPLNEAGYHWISTGYVPLSQGVAAWAGALFLPWVTLATVQAAVYTRLSRGSLLDTLGEDYIRTARAKGLTERRVVYRHALRAAMTPVVSQLGIDVGTFVGAAVVVEQVFGIGGVGQDSVAAISNGDLPVILSFVLLAAAFVVFANIVVDVLYAVLDQRVRIT
jgi:peptide/nickel transport system permease protein